MSTYNQNMQETVYDVLSNMQTEKQKLKSANQVAEYKLYYAQSAHILAYEKLDTVEKEYKIAKGYDDQGVQNDNLATNVFASVVQASTDVATSVTNTSVAASNVQIAANAVTIMASDMAAVLSFVGADSHTKELYSLALTANNHLQDMAYQAEKISELAMNASADTSEIQASQLLSESTAVKADIENLLKVTEAEFTTLAAKKTADTKTVDSTSTTEKGLEGKLQDANYQLKSLLKVFETSKRQ